MNRLCVIAAICIVSVKIVGADCWNGCCRNWNDFVRACHCEGGTPLPNPPRCLHNGGPASSDPRALQRQRYQAVLQKKLVDPSAVAGFDVNDDAQFVQALTQLYAALYYNTAYWNGYAVYYDKQAAVEQYIHENFYAPRFSKIDAADSLHPDVRHANLEAKAQLAGLDDEARQEVRTAMGQANLPFTFKKFWEAYFVGTRAPLPPDQ